VNGSGFGFKGIVFVFRRAFQEDFIGNKNLTFLFSFYYDFLSRFETGRFRVVIMYECDLIK